MQTTITNSPPDGAVLAGPALPDQKPRRRNGKIACLPAETRELVNRAIDNNTPYTTIVAQLAEQGFGDITADNVGNWARGGYRDYLREKQRNTVLREHADKVLTLASSLNDDNRAGYEKVCTTLVAAKIVDAIQDFDAKRLQGVLAKKPDLFFRAAKAVNAQSQDLSRLRKVELDFQKYRDHVAEQKQKMEKALKPRKAEGLTKEQIAEIHEAMRLL
jgi:hypothetical protein